MGENSSAYDSWPWQDYLWLPSHNQWHELEQGKCAASWDRAPVNVDCSSIAVDCLVYTVVLLLLRACLHCVVALPIAHLCGVYTPTTTPDTKHKSIFLHACRDYLDGSITIRCKSYKFADCAWRCFFYVAIWIYAYSYLSNAVSVGGEHLWIFDFAHLWHQYPEHPVTAPMRTHYILEAAYYWGAMLVCLKNDRSRKDFTINTVHHAVTLLLIYMSWYNNMTRAGTLVLLIHDAADGFIELGKMVRYATSSDLYTNVIFGVFIMVWAVSRLGVFPFMIWSGLVEAQLMLPSYHFPLLPALLLVLLAVLQVLHIIWTIMIVNIIRKAVQPGGHTDDARSDSEDDD